MSPSVWNFAASRYRDALEPLEEIDVKEGVAGTRRRYTLQPGPLPPS